MTDSVQHQAVINMHSINLDHQEVTINNTQINTHKWQLNRQIFFGIQRKENIAISKTQVCSETWRTGLSQPVWQEIFLTRLSICSRCGKPLLNITFHDKSLLTLETKPKHRRDIDDLTKMFLRNTFTDEYCDMAHNRRLKFYNNK